MPTKGDGRLTMSLREFSEVSGLSRNTVYSLAARGELGVPVLRLGKRLLLSRRAVLRMLDSEGAAEPSDAEATSGH